MASQRIAWAAGLFEGEGWINIRKQSRNNGISVRLGLQTTDLDVLLRFLDAVGVKKEPYERKRQENRKPIWCIEINKREDVRRILKAFIPLFGSRRTKKALEALDVYKTSTYYKRGERHGI